MKIRGNKYWQLVKSNTAPCDKCGKTKHTAMIGIGEKNEGVVLCEPCALEWGEAERETFEKLKALFGFIRRHLISTILIFIIVGVADLLVVGHFVEVYQASSVETLTEWAYPKVDQRVSKPQVRRTIEAHRRHSKMPIHTLAIVMAESRLFPGATNTQCADAWGGGQVRWKVWKEELVSAGIIQNDERDLFDIEVTAKSVSYVLEHYMGLLPDNLRTPGIKITYALTMYVGDARGKNIVGGLARRNKKLTSSELREIIAGLDYPVEVLAYVGEMAALYPERNLIEDITEKIKGYVRGYLSPGQNGGTNGRPEEGGGNG